MCARPSYSGRCVKAPFLHVQLDGRNRDAVVLARRSPRARCEHRSLDDALELGALCLRAVAAARTRHRDKRWREPRWRLRPTWTECTDASGRAVGDTERRWNWHEIAGCVLFRSMTTVTNRTPYSPPPAALDAVAAPPRAERDCAETSRWRHTPRFESAVRPTSCTMQTTADDLAEAVDAAEASGVDWFVLGLGANILVGDGGFRGLVIRNRARHVTWLRRRTTASG